jgi:hypothetical protein
VPGGCECAAVKGTARQIVSGPAGPRVSAPGHGLQPRATLASSCAGRFQSSSRRFS